MFGDSLYREGECYLQEYLLTQNAELHVQIEELKKKDRARLNQIKFLQIQKANAEARAEEAEKKLGQAPTHIYARWIQKSIRIDVLSGEGKYTVWQSYEGEEVFYVF